MKPFFLTCFFLLALCLPTVAQEIFIKTGLNATTFNFRSADGVQLLDFAPGRGNSIEMGVGIPLLPKIKKDSTEEVMRSYAPNWLKNEVSLNLDSYNSFGGDQNNNYSWETTYGGLSNTLSFLIHINEVELGVKGILGLSGLITGTQVINNSRFSLNGKEDFQGLYAKTGLGASASYPVFQRAFLNLTYSYSKISRLGGPEEEQVRFLTHRLMFGLYVQLN